MTQNLDLTSEPSYKLNKTYNIDLKDILNPSESKKLVRLSQLRNKVDSINIDGTDFN
jgi:hypothetical protein